MAPHCRLQHDRSRHCFVARHASLRFIAAQHQDDAELTQLIGELTLKGPDFAAMWTKHPYDNASAV
nr:hypothetical protein [Cryobacterium luteum]